MRNSTRIRAYLGGAAGSAPVGGSVKIIGTHYDALGNATKVRCDTKAGDFIIVRTFGADPPILDVQFSLNNSVDGQIFTGKILIKYP